VEKNAQGRQSVSTGDRFRVPSGDQFPSSYLAGFGPAALSDGFIAVSRIVPVHSSKGHAG
jgi:hypothetical protein